MLLLLLILLGLFTYKLFSSWIWWLLPIIIIIDLGLWVSHHLVLIAVIIAISLVLYDRIVYQGTHHHRWFSPSSSTRPKHMKP
ncbi:hypothetical protein ACUIJQ_05670 [Levilactobacillus hammesii]|uniref:hypothetical protein n=1 Tax=Levilactobacillus hammesii TaxID=267633 RepID=UPI00070E74B9|nr:hypothetical protein [Levilactobacillus hammesii]